MHYTTSYHITSRQSESIRQYWISDAESYIISHYSNPWEFGEVTQYIAPLLNRSVPLRDFTNTILCDRETQLNAIGMVIFEYHCDEIGANGVVTRTLIPTVITAVSIPSNLLPSRSAWIESHTLIVCTAHIIIGEHSTSRHCALLRLTNHSIAALTLICQHANTIFSACKRNTSDLQLPKCALRCVLT